MATRSRKRKAPKSPRVHPGAPPGALIVDPDSSPSVIRVIAYNIDHAIEKTVTDVNDISSFLQQWSVVWINVDGLGHIDTLKRLGEMFNIHPLALEDVLVFNQRPKVEEYDQHLFLVLRMLEESSPIVTEQVSMFVGDGYVLTLQEHPGDCLEEVRQRIRQGRGRVRSLGADYLAYCLLDAIVDFYFPCMDHLSEQMDRLEEQVLKAPTPDTVGRIHRIKHDLLAIRRSITPIREAINRLIRDRNPIWSDTTLMYLRDCYDHVVHIVELTETYREILSGLLDVYLSSVSNRMNDIMKVLTVIATVFIPLTFVAGVYGMNFDPDISPWNMPEIVWYWGYPATMIFMVIIAFIELYVFWRKGWLGAPKTLEEAEQDIKNKNDDS